MELRGREVERAAIDHLLADAREGLSGVLVLRGEPGIGKTALVDAAQAAATPDFQVLRVVGVEAESGFAYGVLYRLLVPFGAEIDALPAGPRAALHVAFGLDDGPAADLHIVGLAALTVLADIAAERPLLVCIDDAQWVDAESLGALAVVARRIFGEGIGMLFASRSGSADDTQLAALPELQLGGLDHASALSVLHGALDGTIDATLADRIVRDTGGNPLALTDFGGEWSAQGAPGGVPLGEPVPIGPRLEAHYLQRVRALAPPTQSWLLLAAAEPAGDTGYIATAAAALGVPDDAATAAEQAGIVFSRSRVEFRHPLVRSAIYNGAPSADRRRAHAALAAATTRGRDADRRARHRAAACTGPDEAVAAALVAAADRAETRGGLAARAELLTRAAALTPNDQTSAQRLLAAAEVAFHAGLPVQALALLDQLLAGAVLDDASRARVMTLQGDLGIMTGEPNAFATVAATSVRAAALLAPTEPALARDALCRACRYAINAEHLLVDISPAEIAAATRDVMQPTATPTVDVQLAAAYAAWMFDGYEVAVPMVRAATARMLDPDVPAEKLLKHFVLAVMLCTATWDKDTRAALLVRVEQVARETGSLDELDTAKFCIVMTESGDGRLDAAEVHLAESLHLRSVLGATSDMWEIYKYPELIAWRAREAHLNEALQGTIDAATTLGIGAMVSIAYNGLAMLELGRGNYDAAFAAARQTFGIDPVGVDSRGLPNLVEAAVRSGRPDEARIALTEFERRATAAATTWASGLLARTRALVAGGAAEAHFRRAIELLAEANAGADLARAHLLFGEQLRRDKRKTDAREQLRIAFTMFSDMGADAFAERARIELAATGEQARKRSADRQTDLTPQEQQVARLAAAGDTNVEIGERLYISARTVDYHLRKVYRKLDVSSRRELRRFFPAS